MNIALVCPYDLNRPGGVKSHILGLAHALGQRGHHLEIIAPNPSGSLEGIPVVACGSCRKFPFGGTQIDLTWAPWRQVLKVAARDYQVMHFHTLWNPFFPLQLAACFPGPKVATFHDAPGPQTPPWAKALMPWASQFLRKLWLKQVIAVSPLAAAHLKPGSFHRIPNGLWLPQNLPPQGQRDHLLFLGRLETRKGIGTLLKALHLLGSQAPPLWIAGDGPLRSEMETLSQGLSVEFLGQVDEEQKWSLLRRARILVAPSSGGESFGIVLIEAMACGTPPLAAENPGYFQVLEQQAQTLLFPVDDAGALAQKLTRLWQDQALWNEMQSWGQAQWQQYDWRSLAGRLEDVYRKSLGD